MRSKRESGSLIEDWRELGQEFEKAIPHAKTITREHKLAFQLDSLLKRAGKLFYDSLAEIDLPFELHFRLRELPYYGEGESTPDDERYVAYREYWLCILGQFNYSMPDFYGFTRLEPYQFPPSEWASCNEDAEAAEKYFLKNKDYVGQICEASQLVFDFIIRQLKKKPKQPSNMRTKSKLECPECHNTDSLLRPVDLAKQNDVSRQNIDYHMDKHHIPKISAKEWLHDGHTHKNQRLTCERCWRTYQGDIRLKKKNRP